MVVTDLAGTIGFYRDMLGFDVDAGVMPSGESGWALLRKGDVVLLFQSSAAWGASLAPEACGLVNYRMYVDDIRRLYDCLQGRVRIVRTLAPGASGGAEFSIRDCNGFILTFLQAENN